MLKDWGEINNMGMFSEINASGNAERLERVLRVAMKYQSRDVWEFARNHIYPLYCDEIGESWGCYKEPDDVRDAFGEKLLDKKGKKTPKVSRVVNKKFKLTFRDEDEREAMDYLSGRVIYSKGNEDDTSIGFYCGPETTGGYLDDSCDFGIYEQLEKLFEANKIEVDVGSSENHHNVYIPEGKSADEVWKEVVRLLELAGAVEMKD